MGGPHPVGLLWFHSFKLLGACLLIDNSLAITNGYETEAIRWLRWVPRDEMKALELLVTCGC